MDQLEAQLRPPYASAMPRSAADAMLARRVWRAMFDYLLQSAPRRTRALARRGLTPNDSRALFSLDAQQGRSMRSLAVEWQCDPSNATWIIDRLETLGLAERRDVAHDRRVRSVALTAKGARTRSSLMKEFYDPPPQLAALEREELQALDRILSKLAAASSVESPGARNQQRRRRNG
jgi:DNA-binding MarR family transcriptional regulator